MPDQTPVTDDDRRTAYEWAASLDPDMRCWTDRERAAARVILATVPAPTLSEEWRDMLEKQDAGEAVSFSGLLARTDQMEYDLAQTIAEMRWEYRTEEWSGNYWYPCEEWNTDASLYEGYISRDGERLARRLVSPVEVIDGE